MPLKADWRKWSLWGNSMQADLRHTGFFTGKIKAFSTERNGPQKVVFSGNWLKKCFPFMFASAFMFTSCSEERKQNAPEEYKKIYTEVVDNFHLHELEGKEPYSFSEIMGLMNDKNVPVLRDTNYNHCPENTANFWEIVKNGIAVTKKVQNVDSLTAAQKKEYRTTMVKMLSRLSRYKDTRPEIVQFLADMGLAREVKDSIDVTDYNNLQLFLYAEKLIKYQENYETVLGKVRGDIDERADIIGRYYKDFMTLLQKADKYPGIERFTKAFYLNDDRFILANEDMRVTKPISKRMFDDWCIKNEVKDSTLWEYADNVFEAVEYNAMTPFIKRGVKFGASVTVGRNGHEGSPVYEVITHELMHIFQLPLNSGERPFHNKLSNETVAGMNLENRYEQGYLAELGPSLYSLMVDDLIYKEVHGIAKDKVVDYGVTIDSGERKIELGKLAVWVQRLVDESKWLSMDKILAQKKALEYLNFLGGGERPRNRDQIKSSEPEM